MRSTVWLNTASSLVVYTVKGESTLGKRKTPKEREREMPSMNAVMTVEYDSMSASNHWKNPDVQRAKMYTGSVTKGGDGYLLSVQICSSP